MKLRYLVFIILIAVVVISMVAIGFASRKPAVQSGTIHVKFAELIATPAEFNERSVLLEAFIFLGFEVNVLCENLELSGRAPQHLIPWGALIWIEGAIPSQVYRSLYIQQMTGPIERYGKVSIQGKFQTGGNFGHLNGYNLQIIPSKIGLLIWSP